MVVKYLRKMCSLLVMRRRYSGLIQICLYLFEEWLKRATAHTECHFSGFFDYGGCLLTENKPDISQGHSLIGRNIFMNMHHDAQVALNAQKDSDQRA